VRWTWAVVGGVATLLVVAGVDAFRSDGETSAPTTSATTAESPAGSVPPCAQRDIRIGIEIREGVATVVARNIGANDCYRLLTGWRLEILDREGRLVEGWNVVGPLSGDFFPSGSEKDFWLPQDPPLCNSPGPFVALASVDTYSAHLDNVSRSEVACGDGGGRTPVSRRIVKYIARANAICTAENNRARAAQSTSGTELTEFEVEAAWQLATARASEAALGKLRALPIPANLDRVSQIYALMRAQTDVLYETAEALSTGDRARVDKLGNVAIRLIHRKDGLVQRLALLWGVAPYALYGCPVSLPG
jgi:hypothetical protein